LESTIVTEKDPTIVALRQKPERLKLKAASPWPKKTLGSRQTTIASFLEVST
jgi:hypothetical protein